MVLDQENRDFSQDESQESPQLFATKSLSSFWHFYGPKQSQSSIKKKERERAGQ